MLNILKLFDVKKIFDVLNNKIDKKLIPLTLQLHPPLTFRAYAKAIPLKGFHQLFKL